MPGLDACVGEGGGACTAGVALSAPFALAVSKDGKHVYVTSFGTGAVATFQRTR